MNLPSLPPLPEKDFDNSDNGDVFGVEKTYYLTDAQVLAYAEQYGRLCAEAERGRLMDGAWQAIQSDTENGVKWLNTIEAERFRSQFPALNAWLAKENT